jgi:hypothetical protein
MPPNGHAELAHAQAADWVLGTLGPDEVIGFQLHLRGCPHCQAAVAEFGQLGQMLRHLPPAAEPPPELEARTIAGILALTAEDRTSTQVHQIPDDLPAATEDQRATEIRDVPGAFAAAADASSPAPPAETPPASAHTGTDEQPGGLAKVIRFPRWPGRAGLLAIAGAAAAAIVAAVLVLPGLGGGAPNPAFAFTLTSPSGSSGQAASGTATARQDASGSWDVTVTVRHLTHHDPDPWYECWYISRDDRQAVSAGTFLVPPRGSGTFVMTSAADPRDFQTMEITIQTPNGDGALQRKIVLIGQARKL